MELVIILVIVVISVPVFTRVLTKVRCTTVTEIEFDAVNDETGKIERTKLVRGPEYNIHVAAAKLKKSKKVLQYSARTRTDDGRVVQNLGKLKLDDIKKL